MDYQYNQLNKSVSGNKRVPIKKKKWEQKGPNTKPNYVKQKGPNANPIIYL